MTFCLSCISLKLFPIKLVTQKCSLKAFYNFIHEAFVFITIVCIVAVRLHLSTLNPFVHCLFCMPSILRAHTVQSAAPKNLNKAFKMQRLHRSPTARWQRTKWRSVRLNSAKSMSRNFCCWLKCGHLFRINLRVT